MVRSRFVLIDAIYYASDIGCTLTSNSWGGSETTVAMEDALEDARLNGVLFIAAAGNSGWDNDERPIYPASHEHDNVIAVAATDHNDELATFSCYGATSVDVGAPGVDILSTFPSYMTDKMEEYELTTDYASISGTSMAAPHVAGLCALLRSIMPSAPVSEIKDRVLDKVDLLTALDGKVVSGGRINAFETLFVPEDPTLVFNSVVIDDSAGSNDGFLNPGETVELTLAIRNDGRTGTTGVNGVLSTSDSYITVTSGDAAFGDVPSLGQPTLAQNPCTIEIDPSCPTPHDVEFNLQLTDSASTTWDVAFTLSINTTTTISGTVILDGAPLGNATVRYSGPLSGAVTTAANGTYLITAIDGNYTITVRGPDFIRVVEQVVTAPPDATGVDFDLNTATVSGRITDAITGDPLKATVYYLGDIEGEVVSNADGNYSFTYVYGQPTTVIAFAYLIGYHISPSVLVTVPPSQTIDFAMGNADIEATPMQQTVETTLGATATATVNIDNPGGYELLWTVEDYYFNVDSSDIGGPSYDWIEISSTGTEITGLDADGSDANVGPFDIGFTFPFYGRDWTTFRVCSNGWISFNSSQTDGSNYAIPSDEFGGQMIALFWDDLYVDSQTKCYYQQVDDSTLVVQYQDFTFQASEQRGKRFTGQVILKSNGEVYLQYKTVKYSAGASVGIQDLDAAEPNGSSASYNNSSYPDDNMAIRFVPKAPWMTIDPMTDTVPEFDNKNIILTFDTDAAGIGTHHTAFMLDTNAPGKKHVTINVTLVVNEATAAGTITLPVANADVEETAGSIDVVVQRIGDSNGEVSVYYETQTGSADASDFTAASGTLTWADGNADDQTVSIDITDDADVEDDENFQIKLSSPTGGATIGNDTETITILANDVADNHDPVITDGPNADPTTVTIPNGIALDVIATDADGDTLSYAWSKQAGPGDAAFSAQAASTTATFNTAGDYTIEVVVSDGNGGSAGGTVDVTVEAAPSGDGEIVVTGNTDFGATYVVDGTSVRTFTIRNDGTGVLQIENVSLGGPDAGEFSITADPVLSIAADTSTTVDVTFDPASEGGKSATLTIVSDDPTDGTVVLDLTGEALAGSTPALPPPSGDDDGGCGIASGLSLVSWLPMFLVLVIAGVRSRKK